MTTQEQVATAQEEDRDAQELRRMGYAPKLHRAIGGYTSFAFCGFSMVSITTGIFSAFSTGLVNLGGVSVWLWFPVTAGIILISFVFAHLSARIPLTGYAYQWSSRIGNTHLGWFTGWAAFLAFVAGTDATATTFATIFAPDFWSHPSQHDIQLLAAIVIVVCAVLNLVGVKVATLFNNVAASAELIGTTVIALITAIGIALFFKHSAGPAVLFKAHPAGGGKVSLSYIGLAALLPIATLIGWEGCADLAEETKDPRRTAPRMMMRSLIASAVGGFLLFAIFEMAIPGKLSTAVGAPQTPLVYILDTQFGRGMGDLFKAIGFVAIISCCLANMAVATRLMYSLSRDRMLPGSTVLSSVNGRTRTPIACIAVIASFALIINLFSAGIVARVFSIVTICYYLVYMLTLVAVLLGDRAGRIPEAPGYFGVGRKLRTFTWIGIIYTVVAIVVLTVPGPNHIAAEYSLGAVAIGALWWLVYLRRQIIAGVAGPMSRPDAPAPVITPQDTATKVSI